MLVIYNIYLATPAEIVSILKSYIHFKKIVLLFQEYVYLC